MPDRGGVPDRAQPTPTAATTEPLGEEPHPPPTPDRARELFGDRCDVVERYVALLSDTGIAHGLVGPRERPRLWDRHVLGCAVVTDVVPVGAQVIDVGSGAGLPGLVMAIRRPDLHLQLVEPLHRRVVWLRDAVQTLELDNVTVLEGRAETCWGGPRVDVVTARAVARIGVLAGWTLPLLTARGRLGALKGSSAADELAADEALLRAAGAKRWEVAELGHGVLDPPTTVVSVWVDGQVDPRKPGASSRLTGRAGSARRRKDRPRRSS